MRTETKRRARALQLLYAWDIHGRADLKEVAFRIAAIDRRLGHSIEIAEEIAAGVVRSVDRLDSEILEVAENWRLSRIGGIERNILRLALHEMERGEVPTPVVIDEAVKLAHWFAGPKAPGFVNGVLDALARKSGYL